MKKCIFVGGTDKLDILIYTASILHGVTEGYEKKCLLVDFTDMQKARYVVPSVELDIKKPKKYITTHERIDVAVGYTTYDELVNEKIIYKTEVGKYNYKYVFLNVDNPKALRKY